MHRGPSLRKAHVDPGKVPIGPPRTSLGPAAGPALGLRPGGPEVSHAVGTAKGAPPPRGLGLRGGMRPPATAGPPSKGTKVTVDPSGLPRPRLGAMVTAVPSGGGRPPPGRALAAPSVGAGHVATASLAGPSATTRIDAEGASSVDPAVPAPGSPEGPAAASSGRAAALPSRRGPPLRPHTQSGEAPVVVQGGPRTGGADGPLVLRQSRIMFL